MSISNQKGQVVSIADGTNGRTFLYTDNIDGNTKELNKLEMVDVIPVGNDSIRLIMDDGVELEIYYWYNMAAPSAANRADMITAIEAIVFPIFTSGTGVVADEAHSLSADAVFEITLDASNDLGFTDSRLIGHANSEIEIDNNPLQKSYPLVIPPIVGDYDIVDLTGQVMWTFQMDFSPPQTTKIAKIRRVKTT